MSVIIPNRRMERGGTAANLASVNEVLLAREWCVETDTRKVKIGDGVTPYNSLPYVGELANLGNPSGDRLVYWDDAAGQFAFLTLGTGLTIGSGGDLDVSGGGGSGQSAIQFKDEGVNQGSSGAITSFDVVGAGSLAVAGTAATLTLSGGMTLRGSYTVSGSARNNMPITGLNLTSHERYRAEVRLVTNPTGSAGYFRMYANGSSTASDHGAEVLFVSGSGVSAGSFADGTIGYLYASAPLSGWIEFIMDSQSKPFGVSTFRTNTDASMAMTSIGWCYKTAANLTALELYDPVGNRFGVGSTFKIYSY